MNHFDRFLERNRLRIESPVSRYVGPGWIPLLDELINALRKANWSGQVCEIKQKFGELRFYTDDDRPEIRELINSARERSRITCESCGQPGTLKPLPTRAVKTLCDSCASKIAEWENQGLHWDDVSFEDSLG